MQIQTCYSDFCGLNIVGKKKEISIFMDELRKTDNVSNTADFL